MTTCKHCQRPIHRLGGMSANGPLDGWADDTRDPRYCPSAEDFNHKPADVDVSGPRSSASK